MTLLHLICRSPDGFHCLVLIRKVLKSRYSILSFFFTIRLVFIYFIYSYPSFEMLNPYLFKFCRSSFSFFLTDSWKCTWKMCQCIEAWTFQWTNAIARANCHRSRWKCARWKLRCSSSDIVKVLIVIAWGELEE
jgi:hypothetical protein